MIFLSKARVNKVVEFVMIKQGYICYEEFALNDSKPTNFVSVGGSAWGLGLRNSMLHDFGFDFADMKNDDKVMDKIHEIDNTFDIMMIVEHFQESLVLLKHLLCWPYKHLVSLKLNVHETSSKSSLSNRARSKLKKWLKF